MAALISMNVGHYDRCIVVPLHDRCIVVRAAQPGDRTQRLAIFAVDFSRWSPRPFSGLAVPCGRQADARPRASLQSAVDAADRRRNDAGLQRLGLCASPPRAP